MKKIATITSLLILAGNLAGCGQKNPEQSSKSLSEPVSDTAVSHNSEKSQKN